MNYDDKCKVVSYVLVPDVLPGDGLLWYFVGIFQYTMVGETMVVYPMNTVNYDRALKLCFKDEAEVYCEQVNKALKVVKFHVEEHMYM